MLVLTRKPGEKVAIGDDITLSVVEIHGRRVTLALEAPNSVHILRGELIDAVPEPVIVWSNEEAQFAGERGL